ncbi:MAG TPA: serine/threonine protein kinase [Oscillatoriaceae cyanobacterium M33_DOE_052]|uniref:non-specific serine/threonine protein kinase n=1 Tax=Planktothricoides sp. SpSt-374 TaxID=2282167 RepID=A0A7C3ZN27_9CYAN|nr:serine/threonine protein kinase [Oscillatoriaceae cyanobacterium M33_DOE_052]
MAGLKWVNWRPWGNIGKIDELPLQGNAEKDLPDFTEWGYEAIKRLGSNYTGGRLAYLGVNGKTREPVVIKQFQFAKPGADWSAYKMHDREIEVLRSLSHPGIPRYFDSFETPDGFCLVQEYKNAESLAGARRWTPENVKKIALGVLEILVYLQNRRDSVIHRDIKPENILVDDALNVYLIDFGLAKPTGEMVAMSSVMAGTPGFMPPEQLFSQELTPASDLYSLGVTLICLLCHKPSHEIGELITSDYRLEFRDMTKHVSEEMINWLEKMVQPNAQERYSNAAAALEGLAPIAVHRTVPEVELIPGNLALTGKWGEVITASIWVKNQVPDTVFQGTWQVGTLDQVVDSDWIYVRPKSVKGNHVETKVIVKTDNLVAGMVYDASIFLQGNGANKTQVVPVKVTIEEPVAVVTATAGNHWLEKISTSSVPVGVFLVSLGAPVVVAEPRVAVILAVILAVLLGLGRWEKLGDKDIEKVAEFSQRWLMAPGLGILGIWFVSGLGIDWGDNPPIKLLTALFLGMGMGGVGMAVLDVYRAMVKRLILALPVVVFGASFTLLGLKAGLMGEIGEVAAVVLVVSALVKQEIKAGDVDGKMLVTRFGLPGFLGVALGLMWLLMIGG